MVGAAKRHALSHRLTQMVDASRLMRRLARLSFDTKDQAEFENRLWQEVSTMRWNKLIGLFNDDAAWLC